MWISSQIRTPTGSSLDASTLEDGEAESAESRPATLPAETCILSSLQGAPRSRRCQYTANRCHAGEWWIPRNERRVLRNLGRSIPLESYRQHAIMTLTLILSKIRNPFRVTSGGERKRESGRFLRSRWKSSIFHSLLSFGCFEIHAGAPVRFRWYLDSPIAHWLSRLFHTCLAWC